jgi:hypothetical protein
MTPLSANQDFFLVVKDYGKRIGVEATLRPEETKNDVFDIITEGNVVQVIRFNISEGNRDVSEDIAREFFKLNCASFDGLSDVPQFITDQIEEEVESYFNDLPKRTDYKEHNTFPTLGAAL